MTEEDLESNEVEIIQNNQLAIIVKESELSNDKAGVLMAKFANFFSDAELWAKKAKAIKVTNEHQKSVMEQARQGRLFLRKIRLEIENLRKNLKEESLREGRAIDKVARILREQIEPIEEYLDKQEHFIEYKEAEKEALIQAEIEKRMEEDRIAEEKRKAEELEVTRRENERLRVEQEKAEISHREAIRKANEESEKAIKIEREKSRKAEEELRLKRQAEMKAEADKIRQEEMALKASDQDKLILLKANISAIKLPDVRSEESKRIVGDVKSYLNMAISKIKPIAVNEEDL